MAIRYEYLFTIRGLAGSGTMNLWTGEAAQTFGGVAYSSTNIVAGVSIAPGQRAGAESRLTVSLWATTDTLRSAFMADPGPALVTVSEVASVNDGRSWTVVPRVFTGRVSSTELRGDVYRVDLVDRYGDPLRPAPRRWSDADQQRRHPGDRGLRHMQQIVNGVIVEWP